MSKHPKIPGRLHVTSKRHSSKYTLSGLIASLQFILRATYDHWACIHNSLWIGSDKASIWLCMLICNNMVSWTSNILALTEGCMTTLVDFWHWLRTVINVLRWVAYYGKHSVFKTAKVWFVFRVTRHIRQSGHIIPDIFCRMTRHIRAVGHAGI